MTTFNSFAKSHSTTISSVPSFGHRLGFMLEALRSRLAARRAAPLPSRLRYDVGETDLNPDKVHQGGSRSDSAMRAEMARMGL